MKVVPFLRKRLFPTGRLQQPTDCTAMMLFSVPFQIFSRVHCTQVSDSGPLGLLLFYIDDNFTQLIDSALVFAC